MNKEEIDNLEDYLKNELPKIEPTIPIANFGSVDLEDLMSSIKQFKKVPTFDELLRENKRLRNQLEEKDKVIEEIKDLVKEDNISYAYESLDSSFLAHEDLLKLKEILEQGKEVK